MLRGSGRELPQQRRARDRQVGTRGVSRAAPYLGASGRTGCGGMTITPRPWVAELDPYVPGRPAGSEDGSLASNESALGASPAVRAAITRAAARIHRYPDPLADELRAAVSRELGVGAGHL